MSAVTLPSHARPLLSSLVGRRIVRARRVLFEADSYEPSPAADERDGATELSFDDGTILRVLAQEASHSVAVAAGPLAAAEEPHAVEVSRDAFWRYRLRREILGVYAWKSLDVPENADELEFGLELELRYTPAIALEYQLRDGAPVLVLSNAQTGERCRRLALD